MQHRAVRIITLLPLLISMPAIRLALLDSGAPPCYLRSMIMPWHKRLSAIGLALLFSVPSGCAILTGGARLAIWSTARQPHQYGVATPIPLTQYRGWPWVFSGLVLVFAVLTSSRRRLWWLWLPVVTLVYCTLLPLQTKHGFFFHRATHPMVGLPHPLGASHDTPRSQPNYWDPCPASCE